MTDAPLPALLLLAVSPAVGSFLAVLADRLPRGEDVIARPSACRACGTRLGVADLVPVLSFAVRRGRCGHCGAAIPPFVLYTEMLAMGAALAAVIVARDPAQMALVALVLWLLVALAVSDLVWFRLPDALNAALFAAALVVAWSEDRLVYGLAGAALGAGSFLALRRGYRALRGREGLGQGDVKLMAGLGALLGPPDLPLMVLGAALAGLAGAALTRGGLGAARALPFGAPLCAAAAALWLWRLSG